MADVGATVNAAEPEESLARRLITSLTAAPIVALNCLMTMMAGASLAFPYPLDSQISHMLGAMLFTACVTTIAASFLSTLKGTFMQSQEAPAMILGLMAAAVYGILPDAMAIEAKVSVIMACFAVATMLTGLVFLLLGAFRVGGLIRYFPFPVIGGVLAGLGLLITEGGFSVSAALPFEYAMIGNYFEPETLFRWSVSVAFAGVLAYVTRRFPHYLTMPLALLVATALFYLGAHVMDHSPALLSEHRWLLGPFPTGGLVPRLNIDGFMALDTHLLWSEIASILSVVLISTIGLLMHASGLELATGREVDLNRELTACGIGNLIAGPLGGAPAFHSVGGSMLARTMDARRALTSRLVVVIWALIILFGAALLSYFPRPVLGGLILFVGASMIWQWLIAGYRLLPRLDWLVILLIVLHVAFIGYVKGVFFGLAAGIVLFQIGYARLNVVKHVFTGRDRRSPLERGPEARNALAEHGGAILTLELQGSIFFGTAHTIVHRARTALAEAKARAALGAGPVLGWLILDFRAVGGADWATVRSLTNLAQTAKLEGLTVIATGLSGAAARLLEKGGVVPPLGMSPGATGALFARAETLDQGLETAEDALLARLGVIEQPPLGTHELPPAVTAAIPGRDQQDELIAYLAPVVVGAGTTLIAEGETSDGLYFVREGRISIYIARPGGGRRRLKTYLAGTVVGELGLTGGQTRTASILADTGVRAWRLDAAAFKRLKRDRPDLALKLQDALIQLLGERLGAANRLLAALGE